MWIWYPDDAPGYATKITDFTNFTESDQVSNPLLSPDENRIILGSLDVNYGYDEVWVVDNVPGSTATPLVQDPGGGFGNWIWHPAWHPDSDTFIYVHMAGGSTTGGAVYVDSATSPGSPTLIKSNTGGYTARRPQFNFDGTRIAYIWDQDSSSGCELRVMDADGTNDSLLDNTIDGYTYNDPPQFSWAHNSNQIAYSDALTGGDWDAYVINDDGTGKTQLDANGDASGVSTRVSGSCWAPDDSFVVITHGNGGAVFRCELDGSDSTQLGTTGPENRTWYRGALIHNNRIWFVIGTSLVNIAQIGSMALDGTDEVTSFDNSDGPGDIVDDFGGGDGWYYN